MTDEADEFGTLATWTAESVGRLGAEHALPAACQGSGTPSALRWLWQHLGLGVGRTLLDSGGGTGGPAALVRQETGAEVLLVDPMPQACAAAARLFGLRTTVGDALALPVPDHSHHAAWSLGVVCTMAEQAGALSELARVVQPGGSVGLLVFVRTVERLWVETPDNVFPTWRELRALLGDARLHVVEENRLDEFPAPDDDWQRRADEVGEDIRRHHGGDPRWRRADAQQRLVGDLLGRGLVEGVVVVARVG